MKKYIIMGAIFVILLAILTILVLPRNEKEKYSKELTELINKDKVDGELITIEYSNSGDMLGNTDQVIIYFRKKIQSSTWYRIRYYI